MNPIQAVLLGTAVGDSVGLPAEGMSFDRIQKRWHGVWQQRLVLGKGMVSDDTEHTVFVAQGLALYPNDPAGFQRALGWKLRWWLLCLPAGIGFATLRGILKLWMGFPPTKSGVFSAGNGPAMRSAIIGAFFVGNEERIREYVKASTRLTHTDPKAETAALAVALTASWVTLHRESPPSIAEMSSLWLSAGTDDAVWQGLVKKLVEAADRQLNVAQFARELGLERGVTGYAYHTVPVALYAWFTHYGDFRAPLESVLNCGGDTDTVGAITGALAAITSPIPQEWVSGLCDFPISLGYLEQLGEALNIGKSSGQTVLPKFNWVVLPIRNVIFFFVVLIHGFRRLIPG